MKKVFLSLAAITLVATGSLTMTSCGSDDSAPVVPPVETGIKLTVDTAAEDIVEGKAFQMSVKKADGTPVEGAELLVDGEAVDIQSDADGIISLQGPAGEYLFSAEYEGEISNEVTVVINPAEDVPSEGTGTFMYKGTSYDIEDTDIVYRGLYYTDATKTAIVAQWQIESTSADHVAVVVFTTPADIATGNYEAPNATNVTPAMAGVIIGTAVDGTPTESVEMEFDATLADNMFTGTYSATAADLNGQAFSLDFDGKTPLVDGSAKAAAKGGAIHYSIASGKTVKQGNITVLDKKLTKM